MKAKCEHPPCSCTVENEGYCSDACGITAGSADESEREECGCQHHGCTGRIAGAALESAIARSRGSD